MNELYFGNRLLHTKNIFLKIQSSKRKYQTLVIRITQYCIQLHLFRYYMYSDVYNKAPTQNCCTWIQWTINLLHLTTDALLFVSFSVAIQWTIVIGVGLACLTASLILLFCFNKCTALFSRRSPTATRKYAICIAVPTLLSRSETLLKHYWKLTLLLKHWKQTLNLRFFYRYKYTVVPGNILLCVWVFKTCKINSCACNTQEIFFWSNISSVIVIVFGSWPHHSYYHLYRKLKPSFQYFFNNVGFVS